MCKKRKTMRKGRRRNERARWRQRAVIGIKVNEVCAGLCDNTVWVCEQIPGADFLCLVSSTPCTDTPTVQPTGVFRISVRSHNLSPSEVRRGPVGRLVVKDNITFCYGKFNVVKPLEQWSIYRIYLHLVFFNITFCFSIFCSKHTMHCVKQSFTLLYRFSLHLSLDYGCSEAIL